MLTELQDDASRQTSASLREISGICRISKLALMEMWISDPFLENAAESYDSSISLSNQKNPSSMGITFTLMPSVTRFVVKGSYHCIIQGVAVKVIKDG